MALVSLTAVSQACPDRPGAWSWLLGGPGIFCNNKNLTSIPDGIPASTTYLTLRHNQIVTIETRKLQRLHSLIWLDIDNNEITSILSQTFAGLQSLQILRLNGNKISVIEPRSFTSLKNLTHLDIRNNQITSVLNQTFAGLRNLQWLHLKNNTISDVEWGSFQHLQNLTELHIENNEITTIFSKTFAGLRNLKQLYLNGNHIKDMQPGGFQHLQELTTLRLDNNRLKTLPNDIFSTLHKLRILYLSHNQITTLAHDIFVGLNQLSELNLSYNSLTVIPSSVANLTSLRDFQMAHNDITAFSPGMFSNSSIQKWDLSYNNITMIQEGTFSSRFSYQGTFLLNNNHLETLPSTLCDLTSDFSLTLSNNPWSCDCRMRRILDCPNLKDKIICRSPPVLNNIKLSDLTKNDLNCSPPTIDHISSTVHQTVVGDNATVYCNATGFNRPTLTWSRTIAQPTRGRSEMPHYEISTWNLGYNSAESSLTITDVQMSEQGHYTCHASNSVGEDLRSFSLFVIPVKAETTPSKIGTQTVPSFFFRLDTTQGYRVPHVVPAVGGAVGAVVLCTLLGLICFRHKRRQQTEDKPSYHPSIRERLHGTHHPYADHFEEEEGYDDVLVPDRREIPGEESTEGHQYQSLLLETRDHNYTALWREDATFDDQDAYRRQEEDRDGPECSQGDMAEEAAKPEESDDEPTHSYQNIPHDDDYYNFPTVRDV
ncbi:uncharacterized protein LOC144878055 [Branchiostoma floridae x Branchiostoma japonicum]